MAIENKAQVKDIMSTFVMYIKTTDTVQEAISKMRDANVKKAIILDEHDKPRGHTDSWKLRLADMDEKVGDAIGEKNFIYSKVKTVYEDRLLNEIVDELRKEAIMLVTDDKGNNIGVITPYDLIKVKSMGLII